MSSKHARLGRFLASARTRAALSLGVVLAVGATGTFAHWTDSATIGGTTFTAGTIDLKIKDGEKFEDAVTGYTSLNLTAMVPGSTTAGLVVIKNNGTAPLKYTARTTATPTATPPDESKTLRANLVVKVTGDTAVTPVSGSATCAGNPLPNTTTKLNTGLITTGRPLLKDATDTLCIQVTLPSNADTGLQGTTTSVDFLFTGTSDLSS